MGRFLIYLAVLSAMAIAKTASGAEPRQLLVDGDFERPDLSIGTKDVVGRWALRIHEAPDASVEVIGGKGRDGSRCIRYFRTEKQSRNIHLDQVIPVQRNAIYELRAWVRSDGKLDPVFAVQTMKWKTLAQTLAGKSPDWTEVRLVFHSYENDQLRLVCFLGATGKLYSGVAGTSYLDDVSIVRLDPVPPSMLRAFEVTRPRKGEDRDLATIQSGPIGNPLPLRPITCEDGVLVYEDNSEVALWGVNIQTALSWEWNGRLRKVGVPLEAEALNRITDENLEQLRRMDLGVVRLHLLPADFSDSAGNLRDSVFLDVLDHLIDRCGKLGIYVYLTLVNEMSTAHFKDSFLVGHEREKWLFDPDLVECTERYAKALIEHKNRYNGRPYKSDPTIAVLEIMNEPRYPDFASLEKDPGLAEQRAMFESWCEKEGVTDFRERFFHAYRYEVVRRYLDRMCAALRGTGLTKPIVWNLNWPRMINDHEDVFQAVADSPVDAVSFCCYPGQSDVPSPFWANPADLSGNNYLPYLRKCYTDYSYLRWMLGRRFAGKAKMAYEFESMYNHTAYLYPAMARLFRSLGAQIAPMWQYTLSPVAEHIGGSHYLNLYCTPGKAVSFQIANHIFTHTPRFAPYDVTATEEIVEDEWAVSFPHRLSVLQTPQTLMHSGTLEWNPIAPHPGTRNIVGCGNSPIASYDGTGSYSIQVSEEAIDLTINPDVNYTRPIWQKKSPSASSPALCELDSKTPHRFTLCVADWKGSVVVRNLEGNRETAATIANGKLSVEITPGRYRVVRKDLSEK